MSDVKMCDKCGRIFSVYEEGWQRMTVQQSYTDAAGDMQARNKAIDVCNQCAIVPTFTHKAVERS